MDRADYFSEMIEACVRERGMVIFGAVTLESRMNLFLAIHFCKNNGKEIELMETVFATRKYTFDNKRDTIQAIFLNNKNEYNIDGKTLCKDLQTISYERNIFAHYPLDNSDESIDSFKATGTFTFLKYENSKSFVRFDSDKIQALLQLMSHCSHQFGELINLRLKI